MAEVYLARRRAAGIEKWLVVKRIRPERSGDARFLDLFVREARLSMSLVHQNIVPVFDFGRIDDQVFLAMERVEGKDLGSTLARAPGRRISPLVAAFIACECCQALDYAHHRKSPDGAHLGIVHRDVTPRNVLLSWSGEVKLTDFGIAALAGDATAKLLGTPAYMAPEQARSEPLDARADVYAVGLLLREMLTGQRARPGTEREHYIEAAKVGAMLPWPDDLRTPLIAIVDRATSILPDDRYPDARSMLEELDAVIVGERAARKSEAPARLLAAWLAEVWAGEHDEHAAEGEVDGNHLVSFLDDGALDVIGTGTERSLLATAADDGDAPPASVHPDPANGPSSKVEVRASAELAAQPAPSDVGRLGTQSEAPPLARASSPELASGASSPGVASSPGGDQAALLTASGAHAIVAGRRIGTLAIALILLAAAGIGALAMRFLRDDKPAAVPGERVATGVPPVIEDAPARATADDAAAPADASGQADTNSVHGDLPQDRVTTGPDRPSSGQDRPSNGHNRPVSGQIRPTGGQAKPTAAGSGAQAPEAALVKRRVSINATPWAYFTIDGDSTQHETMKTVLLAPGKHRIHFSNPVLKVERDVTIEVPEDRDTSHVERLGD